jgi:hypothetical protein
MNKIDMYKYIIDNKGCSKIVCTECAIVPECGAAPNFVDTKEWLDYISELLVNEHIKNFIGDEHN